MKQISDKNFHCGLAKSGFRTLHSEETEYGTIRASDLVVSFHTITFSQRRDEVRKFKHCITVAARFIPLV